MGWLTKYGLYWGQVPHTTGRVFFVSPSDTYTVEGRTYPSSDGHDGLSPERALRTVAQAITNATASAGDIIALLEGTHTVTATVAVNKAGLTFVGVNRMDLTDLVDADPRPPTILTSTGTSDELLNITADNVVFRNLTIRGTSAYSAVSWQTTSAVADTKFIHCHFDLYTPAVSATTVAVDLANRRGGLGNLRFETSASDVSRVLLDRCSFEADGAQGPAVWVATGGVIARNCTFVNTAGTWATPWLIATDAVGSRVERSRWECQDDAAMSCGISGSLGGVASSTNTMQPLFISHSYFTATPGADAIRGFAAGRAPSVVDTWYAAAANRVEPGAAIGVATFAAVARLTG